MSRQLQLDDDDNVYGAVDPRTDFTHEFKLERGDTSRDEEIARRLQMAEEDSNINFIDAKDEVKEPPGLIHARYAEAQKQNAEQKRKEAEQALQRERNERQRIEQEHAMAERNRKAEDNIRKIDEYNKLAAERAALRAAYNPYDRLYNWSLTLLPDYDYLTRRRLQDALSSLIRREIGLKSSEEELEEKIRRLIRSAELAKPKQAKSNVKAKSKPKSKAKSKPKKKSKRKGKK